MNSFLDGEIFGNLYWHLTVLIFVEMETILWPYWLYFGYILPKKPGHTVIKNKTIAFIESRRKLKFQKPNKWILPKLLDGDAAASLANGPRALTMPIHVPVSSRQSEKLGTIWLTKKKLMGMWRKPFVGKSRLNFILCD